MNDIALRDMLVDILASLRLQENTLKPYRASHALVICLTHLIEIGQRDTGELLEQVQEILHTIAKENHIGHDH